jgi:archaellum component FlaF (FlaF/FlaG flagellin family)
VSTTTISVTTIPVTTTLKSTTTLITTTTTPINVTPTTTIQVRKTISIIAYSCDSKTGNITLTISNKGNTVIGEDEIKIYINDEDKGTFGKAIEPGTLSKNSVQGSVGQNILKVVAPSNSVRIVFWC